MEWFANKPNKCVGIYIQNETPAGLITLETQANLHRQPHCARQINVLVKYIWFLWWRNDRGKIYFTGHFHTTEQTTE